MLEIKPPLFVKFISCFIYRDEEYYLKAKEILQKKFGFIDFESEKIEFSFTNYYDKEFGKPLFRRFISFLKLRDAASFVKIKLFCIKIEHRLSKNGKRLVNIDPGYITEAKLVLTTTKDYSHRIYLGKAIYAEVTLYYSGGSFRNFTTTYPDFRSPVYKKVLSHIREIYHHQLKELYDSKDKTAGK
jgi:hypothetical protein